VIVFVTEGRGFAGAVPAAELPSARHEATILKHSPEAGSFCIEDNPPEIDELPVHVFLSRTGRSFD